MSVIDLGQHRLNCRSHASTPRYCGGIIVVINGVERVEDVHVERNYTIVDMERQGDFLVYLDSFQKDVVHSNKIVTEGTIPLLPPTLPIHSWVPSLSIYTRSSSASPSGLLTSTVRMLFVTITLALATSIFVIEVPEDNKPKLC